MSMIVYAEAMKMRTYIWETYGCAYDYCGGYVADEEFEKLLANPSKAMARQLLIDQICYWFQVGPEDSTKAPHCWYESTTGGWGNLNTEFDMKFALANDPELKRIYRRVVMGADA